MSGRDVSTHVVLRADTPDSLSQFRAPLEVTQGKLPVSLQTYIEGVLDRHSAQTLVCVQYVGPPCNNAWRYRINII